MRVIYSPAHEGHTPGQFMSAARFVANPEVPERARRLLAAAQADGHDIVAPRAFGADPPAGVHTAEYLDFLAHAHTLWQRVKEAGERSWRTPIPGAI